MATQHFPFWTVFSRAIIVMAVGPLLNVGQPVHSNEPGPDANAEARKKLRQEILDQQGTDATQWGEDIVNPFTNITAEGKDKLKAKGVDVERLAKLKTVLITGNYCGTCARTFVNRDPETILVFGKGFITHADVYSLGPILAVEDAHFMSNVKGADIVWFVDKSLPRQSTNGAAIIIGPDVFTGQAVMSGEILRGDYGWRRADDFLKPTRATQTPSPVADAARKKRLYDIVSSQNGVDTAGSCEQVVNPFTKLTIEGKAKLRARGVDPVRLTKLKAVLLTGEYYGANMQTFINRDPDTVLIIGKGFGTHGEVYSVGPILAAENAHFMGGVTGSDLVWFVDESFPRGQTTGLPVVLAPTAARSQIHLGSNDAWYGDYGWRRPDDFLKLAPITLTTIDLDTLWSDLTAADETQTKAIRKLVSGGEQAAPYLKTHLCPETTFDEARRNQLIADLDSDDFKTRDSATTDLAKMGSLPIAAFRKTLASAPPLEMRLRLQYLLGKAELAKRRIGPALRALEQIGTPEARQALQDLTKGPPDSLLTQEAKTAWERIAGSAKP